jgi:hypothetical protein
MEWLLLFWAIAMLAHHCAGCQQSTSPRPLALALRDAARVLCLIIAVLVWLVIGCLAAVTEYLPYAGWGWLAITLGMLVIVAIGPGDKRQEYPTRNPVVRVPPDPYDEALDAIERRRHS